ncbi:Angiopoietin-related protein 1 [Trichinella britovi]|uniref:Angiopoietin-related protein 1 n=2 Tax=Trichinella TaxID=6333 RepID=A0A0V1DBD0_TRIBR|nr:Angiopoietin-related protein 1 [Trichinella murrelli]KRY58796.1 Angiopoietin-related protein 1 [Trichinella britovi]
MAMLLWIVCFLGNFLTLIAVIPTFPSQIGPFANPSEYPDRVPGSCGSPDMFDCKNGFCIPFRLVRNCVDDCGNAADEECGFDKVLCDVEVDGCGKCISPDRVFADCLDRKYHSYCQLGAYTQRLMPVFRCATTANCVPFEWLNDGHNDCGDYSDEDPCLEGFLCRQKTIAMNQQFTICECINRYSSRGKAWLKPDPLLRRIPGNCYSKSSLMFDCGDGLCIDISEFRNCVVNCPDGSDERCWLGTQHGPDGCSCVVHSSPFLDLIEKPIIPLPELPDIFPEIPDILPELPDILPELPDILPELPDILPELPDILPELPDILPELPDILPEIPDVLPELPVIPDIIDPTIPSSPDVVVIVVNPNKVNYGKLTPEYISKLILSENGVDCSDVKDILKKHDIPLNDGVFEVKKVNCNGDQQCKRKLLCNMTEDDGGWTVIQNRVNGKVDFQRAWTGYKNGFGSYAHDFWLGNEILYELTNQPNHEYEMLITLKTADGQEKIAHYKKFKVEHEKQYYRLHLGSLDKGTGDTLRESRGMPFGTFDRQRDAIETLTCGAWWRSGWWYNQKCSYGGNLNVPFKPVARSSHLKGVKWGISQTQGQEPTIMQTRVMIRRV